MVVTKDADFVRSFLLSREPRKLLLLSVGNTSNADLEALLIPRISEITAALSVYDYLELTRTAIIAHD